MSTNPAPQNASCPACGTLYSVPQSALGRVVKCRQCQNTFKIGGDPAQGQTGMITASAAARQADSARIDADRPAELGNRDISAPATGPRRKKHLPWMVVGAAVLLFSCLIGCPLLSAIGILYGYVLTRPDNGPATTQAEAAPQVHPEAPKVQPEVAPPPPPRAAQPVLEQTPVKLAIVRKPGQQQTVKFEAEWKLAIKYPQENAEHSFAAKFALRYRETTDRIDELQGKVYQRLNYQGCSLHIDYDKEEKVILLKDQEQIVTSLGQLSSTRKLTRLNQPADMELDFGQAAIDPDVQKGIAGFHNYMNLLLGMVTVTVPDKETVAPGDSWSNSESISMASARNKAESTMEMSYKYLGLRKRDNRVEAVIGLKAHILSKKANEVEMKGDGDGEAILNLTTGQIGRVKLDLKFDFDTSLFVDNDARAKGTVELTLEPGPTDEK
jgi:predicted Zn finger-like uncharacterized protein